MSSKVPNICSQEMQLFLTDFLQDIKTFIFEIQQEVYKIAKIPSKNYSDSFKKSHPNLNSIFRNCNQTYQDLKRILLILKGYTLNKDTLNKRTKISDKSPPDKLKSSALKFNQKSFNNITFQNFISNSIISSSKTDDLIYDVLSLNAQNDLKIIKKSNSNPKIEWRNKTYTQFYKSPVEKQPTDVQSFGDGLTKRTNFSSCQSNNLVGNNNKNYNQKRNFSIKDAKIPFSQKEIQMSLQEQNKGRESMLFSFDKKFKAEQPMLNKTRFSKIAQQTSKRNSECIQLIRSIRKELLK